MPSEYKNLLNSLIQKEVDEWWSLENEQNVPSSKKEWKYRFEKFDKSFPIKYVISELAKLKGLSLPGESFGSDANVRDSFSKKFDVQITEKLVFDSTEQSDFVKVYDQIENKALFYSWLSYLSGQLDKLNVPPYYARFAIIHDR
jgi:hypothetical protein